MKNYCLIIALVFVVLKSTFGQSKSAELPSTYDRSSLSLILLDRYDSKVRDLFTKVEVPGKYFENKIGQKSITGSSGIDIDVNSLANELMRQKVGNKIISYSYARQSDGTMSADRFQERGLYNATDVDVLKAKATKLRLDAIKDSGDKIIGQSYVAVLDYTGLREVNEGNSRGWYSDVKLYLFKINFDDVAKARLYNELWIFPDDSPEIKAKKKVAFEQLNFDLQFVSQSSAPVSAQDFKIPPPNYP